MPRKVKNLSTASLIVESTVALTVPDLVLLALLAERNMHGYDIVQELERREVKDWAEMSRPHVYYSLRKLSNAAFISLESQASLLNMRGPTPQIYALTQQGKQAMRAALARPAWAQQRPPPPFRT